MEAKYTLQTTMIANSLLNILGIKSVAIRNKMTLKNNLTMLSV
ncbi:hypothetical protein HMPREF1054_0728 [Haemophilus paraphrohaemolyticus HK411]|uniref:Uncharacterized protein n=1 Tax=Haemophilus paraphrohaemolyticus HK411 TaxID=1095743 RepID=I2NCG8_9PAST|nr:hypothetical protein HMPREF1054_0728 [Haemophilus paraphrohaemolyticus HK411]